MRSELEIRARIRREREFGEKEMLDSSQLKKLPIPLSLKQVFAKTIATTTILSLEWALGDSK